MKKTITISIDVELVEVAKKQGINISATLNNLLKSYLGPKEETPKENKEVEMLLDLAEKWGLNFEYLKFVYDNLGRSFTDTIQTYKIRFAAPGAMEDFAKVRKKLREKLDKDKQTEQTKSEEKTHERTRTAET